MVLMNNDVDVAINTNKTGRHDITRHLPSGYCVKISSEFISTLVSMLSDWWRFRTVLSENQHNYKCFAILIAIKSLLFPFLTGAGLHGSTCGYF